MLIRIAMGLFLAVYFSIGAYVLLLGTILHVSYRDASDPAIWIYVGLLWLGYLAGLVVLWGVTTVALLWPGQRSVRLRRGVGVGVIATGLLSIFVLVGCCLFEAARAYLEVVIVILVGVVAAGLAVLWLSRCARINAFAVPGARSG